MGRHDPAHSLWGAADGPPAAGRVEPSLARA